MTVIDRFEGNVAVLESPDGFLSVPRASLPEGVLEGDVLIALGDAYVVDAQATEEKRRAARARLDRLLSRGYEPQ